MERAPQAIQIVDDIRHDLQEAASNILSLTFSGLDLLRRPVSDTARLEVVFTGLLEACSFQDITGQRLDQLSALLGGNADERPDSALLNGPATNGAGLDQAAADRLFNAPDA